MRWFNIGKKDEYGKQRRIEHRAKYLRASRTGGVSLRAQTRKAGLNLTANTQHGFRVSRTVGKNTQVALQNGRFVFRGRYGKGPTRLNVSKSGVTVSTRNELGSFNWIKPNRSSAKVFGMQVRGKNAAYAQIAFMLITALATILNLVLELAAILLRWLYATGLLVWRIGKATPYGCHLIKQKWQNWRLRRAIQATPAPIRATIRQWDAEQLLAATCLIFIAWGRGRDTRVEIKWLRTAIKTSSRPTVLASAVDHLPELADLLARWRNQLGSREPKMVTLPLLAAIAEQARERIPHEDLPTILIALDDMMLAQGPRSVLQEQMIATFSDFAGIRLTETPDREADAPATP